MAFIKYWFLCGSQIIAVEPVGNSSPWLLCHLKNVLQFLLIVFLSGKSKNIRT